MKTDRKFYKQLRNCGVPFVDAHLIAKKMAKGRCLDAYNYASSCSWSKVGPTDYKWDAFYDELHTYSSLVLPNGSYLINDSFDGGYMDSTLPVF